MKSSFLVLTAVSLATFVFSAPCRADEAEDWLKDIEPPEKKAVKVAPAAAKDGESKSAAKSGSSTKSSQKSGAWNLSDAIEKQEAAEKKGSSGPKENKAVALLKKLKPKAETDESEMTREFRAANKAGESQPASEEPNVDENEYGTINTLSAASLRSYAKTHMKKNHPRAASKLAEKAIDLDPENSDGRQIYAEALKMIVKKQNPRDPHTFNICVKQWYWLAKHAEFDDDRNAANAALKELTGVSPYAVWMRPKNYLTKVLMAEDGVSAAELAEEPEQVR
jgi:hypothetical protein